MVTETIFFSPEFDRPVRICLVSLAGYSETSAHLGFHWLWRLLNRHEEVSCDRAYLGDDRGRESGYPLGGMTALIFTIPYEARFIDLLETLRRLKVEQLADRRTPRSPVIVVGGHAVRLIPGILSPVADVMAMGDAEILSGPLLDILAAGDRAAVLEKVEETAGFFGPDLPAADSYQSTPCDFFEKSENLPVSAYTTGESVFGEAFLTEVGRGCSTRCKFCYISHAQGSFHPFPKEHFMALPERFPGVGHFGLIGAAVGDHPDLEEILGSLEAAGVRASLSSIKIPSMRSSVLEILHRSGEKSLTIAPEAGSMRLRKALHKPFSDEKILTAVKRTADAGFTSIKTYFILGLPGEEDEDILAIITLIKSMREAVRGAEKRDGKARTFHLSAAPFVPKPLTPWEHEEMAARTVLNRRWSILKRGIRAIPGVKLHAFDVKEALLQKQLLDMDPDDLSTLLVGRGQIGHS